MRHVRFRPLPTAFAALAGCAVLLLAQFPARAVPADPPAAGVVANATHFDGLGSPYGGCGLPQAELESPDFVALNVYNTLNANSPLGIQGRSGPQFGFVTSIPPGRIVEGSFRFGF